MPTDEEIKRLIETLQEQIKHHQEQNNEVTRVERHACSYVF